MHSDETPHPGNVFVPVYVPCIPFQAARTTRSPPLFSENHEKVGVPSPGDANIRKREDSHSRVLDVMSPFPIGVPPFTLLRSSLGPSPVRTYWPDEYWVVVSGNC